MKFILSYSIRGYTSLYMVMLTINVDSGKLINIKIRLYKNSGISVKKNFNQIGFDNQSSFKEASGVIEPQRATHIFNCTKEKKRFEVYKE